jgi:hypothetical protein
MTSLLLWRRNYDTFSLPKLDALTVRNNSPKVKAFFKLFFAGRGERRGVLQPRERPQVGVAQRGELVLQAEQPEGEYSQLVEQGREESSPTCAVPAPGERTS